jgi:hypothetical protein
MTWSISHITLASLRKRGSRSRQGYVRSDGLIAVPPLRADKLKAWKQKMGIP